MGEHTKYCNYSTATHYCSREKNHLGEHVLALRLREASPSANHGGDYEYTADNPCPKCGGPHAPAILCYCACHTFLFLGQSEPGHDRQQAIAKAEREVIDRARAEYLEHQDQSRQQGYAKGCGCSFCESVVALEALERETGGEK